MWGKRKKRKTTRIDTLVGPNTEILGDVKFSGGLHIDGTIKGNVTAFDDPSSVVSVSERGMIKGEVRVNYVVLNGAVVGDVHAHEHIELAPNARVTGNVYYKLIEMAMGAEVNGQLVHESETEQAPSTASERGRLEASENNS
ncbi:MAG: polymer-forming cytoskeletal protein [Gammaproteobacteria bacterium]|nr:polymer-forming cytoskeletal protein [Gammaproteobacteria bacterium]MCI0590143.1 polymer-forming cytoskeletal protein [Gammaproteobacteria bacterium]